MIESWILFTLISAFAIGVRDILVKQNTKHNVKPSQMIFEQYFLMFIVVILLFSQTIDFSSFLEHWDLFILKAATLGLVVILYYSLLKEFEISLIAPLMNLSPVFLIFMGSAFLGEHVTLIQVLGILTIIFSTYVLEVNFHFHEKRNPHKFHFDFLKKISWKTISMVFSMLFFITICAISDKMIFNAGINVYTNMYYTGLIIFIYLIFYYLKKGILASTLKNLVHEPQTLVISVFSIISTFFILFALAIPTAMVSLIIPIKRTSTLFSSLIGGVLFHEKHLGKKLLATCGMICGIILIVI